MFKQSEKNQAKTSYENRSFSIFFDLFQFLFFKIFLNFFYLFHLKFFFENLKLFHTFSQTF